MADAPRNLVRTVLTDPVHILAFGFGTGLSPVAPGTVGSLVGVLFAWLTMDLGLPLQLAVAAAISVSGIWICGESARRIGVHDHGGIVWDEIAGMYITLAGGAADDHRVDTGFRAVSRLRYRQTVADSGPGSQTRRRPGNYAG